MKVTVISTVIGTLGTVTKGLIKGREDMEIRGWVKNSSDYSIKIDQNTTYLGNVWIQTY